MKIKEDSVFLFFMIYPVRIILLLILLLPFLVFSGCSKTSFTINPDALITASADTLHFDTVFTSTGSVSKQIKIFNENDQGIHINSVRLAGGQASPFKINVNGVPGTLINSVDIAGKDSLYIFVTLHIDPNAKNLPFIVRDSIELTYNGNKKFIQLDGYGQNAHFLKSKEITGHETWINDLPYVLLDKLVVAEKATLSIEQGCHIYIQGDAPFIVHGSLHVKGAADDSNRVVFTGARLDAPYRDYPASYPGLIFSETSQNNTINYATIKNAYQGIVVKGSSADIKLTIDHTIIDNAYDAGLLGIHTNIQATNLLISNCGKNMVLAGGGNYNFTHCTCVVSAGSFMPHNDPLLSISDYDLTGSGVLPDNLTAFFRNCIFWSDINGSLQNEVAVIRQDSLPFQVTFDQVLWKVGHIPSPATIYGAIHQDPLFDSVNATQRMYSYRLKEGSPAIDKGVDAGVDSDLDGKPRPVGLPDLGAYERR